MLLQGKSEKGGHRQGGEEKLVVNMNMNAAEEEILPVETREERGRLRKIY